MPNVKASTSDLKLIDAATSSWMKKVALGEAEPYPSFVELLFKNMGSDVDNLMHFAAGLAGEAGEVLDHAKKSWANNKDLNIAKVLEELGDTRFYYQAALNHFGLTDEDIQAMNVAKLSKRYASGSYSDEQAAARADKQEDDKFWCDPAFTNATPAPYTMEQALKARRDAEAKLHRDNPALIPNDRERVPAQVTDNVAQAGHNALMDAKRRAQAKAERDPKFFKGDFVNPDGDNC